MNDERLLKNAIERSKITSDQLTSIESPIPIHKKLAIIQVESLDFNAIGHKVGGKEVTPFLNQLKNRSLFYRAQCYHVIGSADADFTMLVGGAPAMNVLNYSLPKHTYDNALPSFLKKYGFRTASLHGNTGTFYTRRAAFEKMGFAEILFREDMERVGSFESDALGLRDRDVMSFSALKFRKSQGPTCHFLITLTSHGPYQFLKPNENAIISKPTNSTERYFNHIHYVDDCLRNYINSLGKGVTVVIYADHATEIGAGDFVNSKSEAGEFVPVFIYDTDRNLAKLQKTRDSGMATDGSLKMLDISSFLRNRVEATFDNSADRDRCEKRE